ncbi:putative reverse transcriptase domain-containing protein [Tanacetum coccineum]
MMTRSVGRPTTQSRGGGMGGRGGRSGGRGRGPREGSDEHVDELNDQGNNQGVEVDRGVEGVNRNIEEVNGGMGGAPDFSTIISQQLLNLLPTLLAQIGNQGNVGNQDGNVVNENVQENIRNVMVNNNRVVFTRWIEKMEYVQDMSGCGMDQKVKYTVGSFVGKALKWWKSQFCTLSREVTVGMSWDDFKALMSEEFYPSHEMQKLESELWNHMMVSTGHSAYTYRFHELARLVPHLVAPKNRRIESKDKNGKGDNKRTRTGNAFATTTNLVGRDDAGDVPKCATCNSYHVPGVPCRTCYNYNRPRHFAKDCRVVPRNVNSVNERNPVTARKACYECGSIDHLKSAYHRNHRNQDRGRVFMLGAEETRQDSNIVMGTFTLNDHYATTLFDSGADYSFVSTTFIPLLGIEPNGHVFDINLIPFGSGSFDVIIGMDWLSSHKAEIVCHEKVDRIPLLDGRVLRVLGERPEEKAKLLMSAKVEGKKLKEMVMVRNFPEVFLNDLSGLPPLREIEFWIALTPRAVSVAKSPYRLAPSEMEELSGQLKEFLDKGFIRPSSSPWGAPVLSSGMDQEDFVWCIVIGRGCCQFGLGGVLMPKELFSDYDCEIQYHPGKANVVADALIDESAGLQKGLDEMIEQRNDGALYYLDRIWIPLKGDVKTLIMDKAHKLKYYVHPGADKMYYDLRDRYWCPGMKKDVAVYDVHLLLVEFSYNNSYHSSVRCAPFKIKDRLKAARDHQKSYADKRRKPLEFREGEYVLLKVSPWKGVVRFRKKGKLAPKYVRPFEITKRIGPCLADPTLQVPLDEIQVDAKLNFVEEHVEIMEREIKKLKRSRITIIKV